MTALCHAARVLLKTPGFLKTSSFSLVAILVLALDIGANTGIFGVANALLLKSLVY
jgi:hypothetical protein